MTNQEAISPAFELFLKDSGPQDKREALVIYKAPTEKDIPPRGSLREVEKRLKLIKSRAAIHKRVSQVVYQDYQKANRRRAPKVAELKHTPIGQEVLPVNVLEVTRATLPALANQTNVLAILPNQPVHLIEPTRVIYKSLAKDEFKNKLTWGLKHLGIAKFWRTSKGKDVRVAVIDSGVYADHPALNHRVIGFVVIDSIGRCLEIKDNQAFDSGQHGTHVCGTIAGGKNTEGVSIGVAPEASLLVASINFGQAYLSDLIAAFNWAIEKGADIISMSFGMPLYDPYVDVIFERLLEQYGIVPVVAIGNEGHGSAGCPGNAHHALSVGAVEKISDDKVDVALFSSGLSLVFPGQQVAMVTKPDIVAPGVDVFSCIPPAKIPEGVYEYHYMDGTSMATPHVAGVMALLMAAKRSTPVQDIIKALKDTAYHPTGAANSRPDNRWGYGLIQPMAALEALS